MTAILETVIEGAVRNRSLDEHRMGAQFLVINYKLGITKKCKQNSRLQTSKHDSLNNVGDLTKCVAESHRQQHCHCDNGIGTSILLRIFSGARNNI